jgi:hypothetical protein
MFGGLVWRSRRTASTRRVSNTQQRKRHGMTLSDELIRDRAYQLWLGYTGIVPAPNWNVSSSMWNDRTLARGHRMRRRRNQFLRTRGLVRYEVVNQTIAILDPNRLLKSMTSEINAGPSGRQRSLDRHILWAVNATRLRAVARRIRPRWPRRGDVGIAARKGCDDSSRY